MAISDSSARRPRKATPSFITYYLVVYNILSTIGWGYILVSTFIHLFDLDGADIMAPRTASSTISDILRSSGFISGSLEKWLPTWLLPTYLRSRSTFARIGPQTALVQTFALLEVVHALLGWVRSPLQTTAMQVASRLFLVWGITERFEIVRTNPLFTSMVFAWSMTEVIRYSFYACNLLGFEPFVLLYLRYTTFYILYPVGASSEAFLIYATLPKSSPIPGWQSWMQGMWNPADYFRALLFCIWWPALYVLYSYMITQRRKVLYGYKLKGAKRN